jgi:hypothetical protein
MEGADVASLTKPADVVAGVVAAVEERIGAELNARPMSPKLEDIAGALDEVDEELLAAE